MTTTALPTTSTNGSRRAWAYGLALAGLLALAAYFLFAGHRAHLLGALPYLLLLACPLMHLLMHRGHGGGGDPRHRHY